MNICQTTQEGKRDELTLLNVTDIWLKQLVHIFLQNNICYFRSPISSWWEPQLKSLLREIFLSIVRIFILQKKSALGEHSHKKLAKLSFKKCHEIFLLQNLGHMNLKKCKNSSSVGFLNESQASTFVHFLYFSKFHWPSQPTVHWRNLIEKCIDWLLLDHSVILQLQPLLNCLFCLIQQISLSKKSEQLQIWYLSNFLQYVDCRKFKSQIKVRT